MELWRQAEELLRLLGAFLLESGEGGAEAVGACGEHQTLAQAALVHADALVLAADDERHRRRRRRLCAPAAQLLQHSTIAHDDHFGQLLVAAGARPQAYFEHVVHDVLGDGLSGVLAHLTQAAQELDQLFARHTHAQDGIRATWS